MPVVSDLQEESRKGSLQLLINGLIENLNVSVKQQLMGGTNLSSLLEAYVKVWMYHLVDPLLQYLTPLFPKLNLLLKLVFEILLLVVQVEEAGVVVDVELMIGEDE